MKNLPTFAYVADDAKLFFPLVFPRGISPVRLDGGTEVASSARHVKSVAHPVDDCPHAVDVNVYFFSYVRISASMCKCERGRAGGGLIAWNVRTSTGVSITTRYKWIYRPECRRETVRRTA